MTEGTRESRLGVGGVSTCAAAWLAWWVCALSRADGAWPSVSYFESASPTRAHLRPLDGEYPAWGGPLHCRSQNRIPPHPQPYRLVVVCIRPRIRISHVCFHVRHLRATCSTRIAPGW